MCRFAFVCEAAVLQGYLLVLKTSSAGWIDAKRAVERQPY
jgi:hypothetical protein